ncbi:MAG TPA: deoxyribonuclease V [Candidatus Paceibacterota bacterium]|nr:deoxyribonuclease V [Candidatus Paceibacterota bacterium]
MARDTFAKWNGTAASAIAIQKQLRSEIKLIPLTKIPKLIGGCDVSMNMFAKDGFAGFVVLSYPELHMVDHAVVKDTIGFPYIPGLLSFREIPMLMKAWKNLKQKPDVIVVDGVGIAHPRRMGIATHLGLALNVPTIGCAKSVLTGVYKEPENKVGAVSYMYDRYNKTEVIGAALRTKVGVKPVYVSPGHLITLQESIELVKNCVIAHRLPEPTRFAHNTVNEYRVCG